MKSLNHILALALCMLMSTACSGNKLNRFNGLGIGFYATSNGQKTKQKAVFKTM